MYYKVKKSIFYKNLIEAHCKLGIIAMNIMEQGKKDILKEEKMPEVVEAMKTMTEAMRNDPELAHGWHCNIAMMCHDAILDHNNLCNPDTAHKIGNDAASRFMKLCFDVETKA